MTQLNAIRRTDGVGPFRAIAGARLCTALELMGRSHARMEDSDDTDTVEADPINNQIKPARYERCLRRNPTSILSLVGFRIGRQRRIIASHGVARRTKCAAHRRVRRQKPDMVDAFYLTALAHGGKDNGAPGERPYHPGYYVAFVLDPDGNNIEAVYHGEATRSSASVHIMF